MATATTEDIAAQDALSNCTYTGKYGPNDSHAHSEYVNDGIYTVDTVGRYNVNLDGEIQFLTPADLGLARFYQVYQIEGPWLGDDEGLYYSFPEDIEHSQVTIKPAGLETELDKFVGTTEEVEGEVKELPNVLSLESAPVEVTVVPSADLKDKYKFARVLIENKEYNLSVLDKPIIFDNFYNNNVKKIKIVWSKDLVETFRVIARR